MLILSSFTHPQVVPKPVWISLFCWTQRRIFWKKFVTRLFWDTIDFHSRKKNTMEVNGAPELLCFPHSSEYLPLCSAEQTHSYRFATTWGWVNDDRINIFEWTIPLTTNIFLGPYKIRLYIYIYIYIYIYTLYTYIYYHSFFFINFFPIIGPYEMFFSSSLGSPQYRSICERWHLHAPSSCSDRVVLRLSGLCFCAVQQTHLMDPRGAAYSSTYSQRNILGLINSVTYFISNALTH